MNRKTKTKFLTPKRTHGAKLRRPTFITYTGNNEVLVTTPDREKKMLVEWFNFDTVGGRSLDEYDRHECMNPILIVRAGLSSGDY